MSNFSALKIVAPKDDGSMSGDLTQLVRHYRIVEVTRAELPELIRQLQKISKGQQSGQLIEIPLDGSRANG